MFDTFPAPVKKKNTLYDVKNEKKVDFIIKRRKSVVKRVQIYLLR